MKMFGSRVKNMFVCLLFQFFSLFYKDRKIFLFGGWFGKRYEDNPKILFEYMKKNTKYKCFFMIKDKKLFQQTRNSVKDKKSILYSRSVRAFFIQLHAKTLICCVNPSCDFLPFVFGGKTILHFSHGTGFKKPKTEDNHLAPAIIKAVRQRDYLYEKFNKISSYLHPRE